MTVSPDPVRGSDPLTLACIIAVAAVTGGDLKPSSRSDDVQGRVVQAGEGSRH